MLSKYFLLGLIVGLSSIWKMLFHILSLCLSCSKWEGKSGCCYFILSSSRSFITEFMVLVHWLFPDLYFQTCHEYICATISLISSNKFFSLMVVCVLFKIYLVTQKQVKRLRIDKHGIEAFKVMQGGRVLCILTIVSKVWIPKHI